MRGSTCIAPATRSRPTCPCSGAEARGELGPRAHAELRVDAREVRLDRPHRDDQLGRHLAVRAPLGDQGGDALLGGGELVAGRRAAAEPSSSVSVRALQGRAPRRSKIAAADCSDARASRRRPARRCASPSASNVRPWSNGSGPAPCSASARSSASTAASCCRAATRACRAPARRRPAADRDRGPPRAPPPPRCAAPHRTRARRGSAPRARRRRGGTHLARRPPISIPHLRRLVEVPQRRLRPSTGQLAEAARPSGT